MNEDTHKQCSACLKEEIGPKPKSDFGRSTKTPDGLSRHCRYHAQKFNRDHRAAHREEIKLQRRVAVKSGTFISIALRKWGLPPPCEEAEGLLSGLCPQLVNQPDAIPQPSRVSF